MKIKTKLTLSLGSIAAVLMVAGAISVLEFSSMSNYVSDMIAEDINNISVAQKLSEVSNRYNLAILSSIGDRGVSGLPEYDAVNFMAYCDSLRASLSTGGVLPMADSIEYAYSAYMLTSLELQLVLDSENIDSREWYFDRLQPQFRRLRRYIDILSAQIYDDLSANSETFDRGFYRSIIPGIVSIGGGILLCFLLLFYLMVYFAVPLGKMNENLSAYRTISKKYNYTFDGDDELHAMNEEIRNLTEENSHLRKKLLPHK